MSFKGTLRLINFLVFMGILILMIVVTTLSNIQNSLLSKDDELREAVVLAKDIRYHAIQIQQFLTDASLTLEDEVVKEAEENLKAAEQKLKTIETQWPQYSESINELKTSLASLFKTGLVMQQTYKNQGAEAGNQVMTMPNTGFDALSEKASEQTENMVQLMVKESDLIVLSIHKYSSLILWSTIVLGLLIVGVVILSLNTLLRKVLSRSVNQISHSCVNANNRNSDLSTASLTLSGSISTTASSLEETAASIEEITSMVEANTENAKTLSNFAAEGLGFVNDTVNKIEDLNLAMKDLSENSQSIQNFSKVIDEIAFQTNLLALNAAVEAARAGEQGKGFAVVAEAVRALSIRSAEAAKEVNHLAFSSNEKINSGSSVAGESALLMKKIVEQISQIANLSKEVSNASIQQKEGLVQIAKAMSQLGQANQENSETAQVVNMNLQNAQSEMSSLKDLVSELEQAI